MTVKIYKDNELKVTFENQKNDFCALKWLLNNQHQSCDYAIRYGGYKVELIEGENIDYWKPYARK